MTAAGTQTRASACLLVFGLLIGAPAGAHHDFRTEFDSTQRITLHGTIVRVEWVNPHGWFHLDVSGSDGRIVQWAVQTASPDALDKRGWRKDSLKPGMVVTVDAFKARSGKTVANGRDITLPDGRKLCANLPCRCCWDTVAGRTTDQR